MKNTKSMAVPVPSGDHSSVSVDVRKIENGYIVRKSSYGEGGKYSSSECFSSEKPKFEVRDAKGADRGKGKSPSGGSSLSKAMGKLR